MSQRSKPLVKRVVLAYSGGLDTSVILCWLKETYNCEVVTFTADLGQGDVQDFVAGRLDAPQRDRKVRSELPDSGLHPLALMDRQLAAACPENQCGSLMNHARHVSDPRRVPAGRQTATGLLPEAFLDPMQGQTWNVATWIRDLWSRIQ